MTWLKSLEIHFFLTLQMQHFFPVTLWEQLHLLPNVLLVFREKLHFGLRVLFGFFKWMSWASGHGWVDEIKVHRELMALDNFFNKEEDAASDSEDPCAINVFPLWEYTHHDLYSPLGISGPDSLWQNPEAMWTSGLGHWSHFSNGNIHTRGDTSVSELERLCFPVDETRKCLFFPL